MSRRTKTIPFKEFERVEKDGIEHKFIRITHIQLVCMQELSHSAFRLYLMMKDYANGNADFSYPHRLYETILSNQGFINARQELINYGYIENFISMQNVRKENKYRFSSKWRERNRDLIAMLVKEQRQAKGK